MTGAEKERAVGAMALRLIDASQMLAFASADRTDSPDDVGRYERLVAIRRVALVRLAMVGTTD